jgi:hypothetical protein
MTTTSTYQYAYILNFPPPHANDTIALVRDIPSYFSFTGATIGAGGTISFTYDGAPQSGTNTYSGYTSTDGSPVIIIASGEAFLLSNDVLTAGSAVTLVADSTFACYWAGTRIGTPSGDVRVEDLRPGVLVTTPDGPRPVRWIGTRRAEPAPPAAWPIAIAPGALGEGMPARTLRVSPEHALYVDGVLVPARHLVNGTSIVQERVAAAEYYHIELDQHAVLFAEGALAESWRDTGNVRMFANAGTRPAAVDSDPYAEIVEGGPVLAAIRSHIAARAAALGFGPSPVLFVPLDAGAQCIEVPPGTAEIRLTSPAWQAEGDRRRLGAAIGRLALDGAEIALHDPRLARGWHRPEGAIRWTDGEATLAVALRERAAVLQVEVVARGP